MNAWPQISLLAAKRGYSARKVAEIAGVVPSAVQKWKAGASVRNDALARLAAHFGVSIDDLFCSGVPYLDNGGCLDADRPPALLREPLPTPAAACRYPEACDLPAELAGVKNRLANIERLLLSLLAEESDRRAPPVANVKKPA